METTYSPGAGPSPTPTPSDLPAFTPVHRTVWGHFKYCLRHYADFQGRATRAEYWSFNLVAQGILTLLALLSLVPMVVLLSHVLQGPIESGSLCRALEAYQEVQLYADRDDSNASPEVVKEREDRVACLKAELDELAEEIRESGAQYLKDESRQNLLFGSMFVLGALCSLWGLATCVPSLAVVWRRLHDINLSGAFFFLVFVPYVGALALMVLTLIDSKPGANVYGPPTKYP